jgi:hypothetical protein
LTCRAVHAKAGGMKKPKAQKPDIEMGQAVTRGDEPRRRSAVELTISFNPMPARVKPEAAKPKRLVKRK